MDGCCEIYPEVCGVFGVAIAVVWLGITIVHACSVAERDSRRKNGTSGILPTRSIDIRMAYDDLPQKNTGYHPIYEK